MKTNRIIIAVFIAGLAGSVRGQSAQEVRPDTARAIQTAVVPADTLEGELVLEAIDIRGRIEKPGVIIVPKRLEPEMERVDLDRSFEDELLEGTGELDKVEQDLDKVERVKNIKKTVGRKRK